MNIKKKYCYFDYYLRTIKKERNLFLQFRVKATYAFAYALVTMVFVVKRNEGLKFSVLNVPACVGELIRRK